MGTYDRQIETAKRLIAQKGQIVTWQTIPDGATAVDTPWKPKAAAPVNHSVSIVFLPLNRVNTELLRSFGATEVSTGNLYGLMGAVNFVPSLKDVVIRAGQIYRITSIDILSPNGQAILYTINFDA